MVTSFGRGSPINRPYPPPSNVTSLLHRLRSRNLPEEINADYLRDAQTPEGTIGRTLFAMRFLGLIGEATEPTEALRSVHTSTDEEYLGILSGLVREAYKDVFSVVDPAVDSQQQILNVFRRYTPASQRGRMVTFFLGICRESGIPTLDVPKARTMKGAVPSRLASKVDRKPTEVASQRGRQRGTPGVTGISPALEGLIRSLPLPGTPLSDERRKQWLEMASATLKFVYPEEAEPVAADQEDTTSKEDDL